MQDTKQIALLCSECNIQLNADTGTTKHNKIYYCDKCFRETFTQCDDCDNYVERAKCFTDVAGNYICPDCYDDHYFTCDDCGEIFNNDDCYSSPNEDNNYCNDCFTERYFYCAQCNEVCSRDDAFGHNASLYCENCYSDVADRHQNIHSAGYKPSPRFKHKTYKNNTLCLIPAKRLYLGFELEVEPDDTEDTVDLLEKYNSNNSFYLKDDGSIDGFEIVSEPHTLLAHRDCQWRKMLNELRRAGTKSYTGGHCGLHVHISRSALSNLQQHKLDMFFHKCQQPLTKFSQRTPANLRQWANFNQPSYTDLKKRGSHTLVHILTKLNAHSYCNRYSALNFNNLSTIEIRIFRGTLNFKRFWASLCLCDCVVSFIKEVGAGFLLNRDADVIWREFFDYTKINSNFLYKYLKGARLCV